MPEKMTQKEVHDLGIGCRWYKTLVKMHDYMSRYMLTDEQIRATEQTDAEAALDARGRQAVYHSIQSGLGEEIKKIDDGLERFNALYGARSYQMFCDYFMNRKSLDWIAEKNGISASSVRRAIHMTGNGHKAKGGGPNNDES